MSTYRMPTLDEQGLFAVVLPRVAREHVVDLPWSTNPDQAMRIITQLSLDGLVERHETCPMGAVTWRCREFVARNAALACVHQFCASDYGVLLRWTARQLGVADLLTPTEMNAACRVAVRVVDCADGSWENRSAWLRAVMVGLAEEAEVDLMARLRARIQGDDQPDLWRDWRAATVRRSLLAADGPERVIVSGAALRGEQVGVPV